MRDLIHAEVVWSSGADAVVIPERMGLPRDDQMVGTPLEQLAELAGRVCYDSLGRGRESRSYHEHIQEVGHLSVYEHCCFTVWFDTDSAVGLQPALLRCLFGRPGVHVEANARGTTSVTMNLRAVLEWDEWQPRCGYSQEVSDGIREILEHYAHQLAPMVVPPPRENAGYGGTGLAAPTSDDEFWISVLLCGSRGFSHEQVRHGDFTAISQRSTRYVDESESPWVEHPLVTAWAAQFAEAANGSAMRNLVEDARGVYASMTEELERWLVARGAGKTTARKQARGAARGYLGNALYTEMIFSANVTQWRRMIAQRCSPAADAEIRAVYAKVVEAFRADPALRPHFRYELQPSPDGIGQIAVPLAEVPA